MKIKTLFLSLAAFATALTIASCKKEAPKDTLSVNPSAPITFKVKGNDDVKIKVTASASTWSFSAPEWVVAKQEKDNLVVNVKDNDTKAARVGRITFRAGNAFPVNVNILQEAEEQGGGSSDPAGSVNVKLSDKTGNMQLIAEKGKAAKISVVATIAAVADKDVEVELFVDKDYLNEYNYLNKQSVSIFPVEKITLPASVVLKIEAGKTESEKVELSLDAETLSFGTQYLVPLYLKAKKNAIVKQDARLNYLVMRKMERDIKNVCYFEVNDTNPLNALEYVLEDGTPFFDSVILFAANINYNSAEDVVYLHNNPNVQALLDNTETYLQPLRKAGIKVYLGLLGNHDAAGLAQLSDWGAKQWAQEVANACKKYKLDGVNLDDEYSGSPIIGNKWFTSRSAAAAGRLMYELKQALKKKCPWPTEVSHFDYGSIYSVPAVTEGGVEHQPSEFVDFHVANYGSASSTYGGLTKKQCSGYSTELNRGYLPSGNWAEKLKNDGYGYCMWFAFDPSGSGNILSNHYNALKLFKEASQAFYGKNMKEPNGYYNKIGEGQYDPVRKTR